MKAKEAEENLRLADSYMDEIWSSVASINDEDILDDEEASDLLNKIKLSLEYIAKAEQIDHEVTMDGDETSFYKAKALAIQGFIENHIPNKRKDAIMSFKKSIELCDDMAFPHFALSLIYLKAGKREKALRYAKLAVELDPDIENYQRNLEYIEDLTDEDMEEMIDHHDKYWSAGIIREKMTDALSLYKEGRYRECISSLNEIVEKAEYADDKLFAAGIICSTYVQNILKGRPPQQGTQEFNEIHKYLKIAVESYDESGSIAQKKFDGINDIKTLRMLLKHLDEELEN